MRAIVELDAVPVSGVPSVPPYRALPAVSFFEGVICLTLGALTILLIAGISL